MAGVLEGIKVVDMGHFVAIPSAAAILADWGAEVIKIEPPTGEPQRGALDGMVEINGSELSWRTELHNRNKRSVALDLKKEAGKKIIYELVEKADVFMTNFQLSALNELEIDYETMSRLNPRLIYASVTGFGSNGPDRDKRGFDIAVRARAGLQYFQSGGMMDRTTGTHVVAGIMAALFNRERTGQGQKLEFSLYHSIVWVLAADIQGALFSVPVPERDRAKVGNPIANTYLTKDGRWIRLQMLQSDLQWPDFCQAIERPDLVNNPRFNNMAMRKQNSEELIRLLDEIFATRNIEVWERFLTENDCIFSRVQTSAEVTTDPQALANNFFAELEHPRVGKIKLVNSPVKFNQNPASIRTPAPEIGQHTEEVLLEQGYSWDDIVRLKDEGVIL